MNRRQRRAIELQPIYLAQVSAEHAKIWAAIANLAAQIAELATVVDGR